MPRVAPPLPASSTPDDGDSPGLLLTQLTTAGIVRIAWPPHVADGDFQYLYRLCGIVRRIAASETLTGTRLRLQGELVAGRAQLRWAARSAIVPTAIADAVKACFAEHPPSSTRDRVTVHIDYDLWAIREECAALGYRLHCEGRAYVPAPLSGLIAHSFGRPVPTAPNTSGG